MYNTGYHLRLGSYPTGIAFVFLTLYFTLRFYKTNATKYLLFAGLASGALVLFKHDMGTYTGIAVSAGLAANYFGAKFIQTERTRSFWRNILVYLAGALRSSFRYCCTSFSTQEVTCSRAWLFFR